MQMRYPITKRLSTLVLAFGVSACLINGNARGQEVIYYGQPITIISERPVAGQADTEVAKTLGSRTTLVAAKPVEENGDEVIKDRVVNASGATKSAGPEQCDCDCMMPGGTYWQMLLSQELENARLTARVELDETKLEFFRDQMTERVERKERELRDRLEAFESREREFENAMNRQRAEFEEQSRRQEERVGELEMALERAERAMARVGELEKLLAESRERIGQMEREREGLNRRAEEAEMNRRERAEDARRQRIESFERFQRGDWEREERP